MSRSEPVLTAALINSDRRCADWHMLAIAVGVMIGAAILEVLPDERVAIQGLHDYPLPHLCMSRTMLGVSCPGCGLTRSFVHLAHGDWQAAWQVHRLGWLLAALVIAQLPYRGLVLAGSIRPINPQVAQWLAITVVGLLVMNWTLSLAIAT